MVIIHVECRIIDLNQAPDFLDKGRAAGGSYAFRLQRLVAAILLQTALIMLWTCSRGGW